MEKQQENQMVSVITAANPNAIDYIGDTANSIIKSRLPEGFTLEWVLQIDGHDNMKNSRKIIKFIREMFSRFPDRTVEIGVNNKNSGVAATRNMAAAQSSGHYMKIFDADDVLFPDGIHDELTIMLEDDNIDYVVSNADDLVCFPDDPVVIPYSVFARETIRKGKNYPGGVITKDSYEQHALIEKRVKGFPLAPVLMRSDVFWEIGGYSAIPTQEDFVLFEKLARNYTGYYLDESTYYYRKWSDKQMTKDHDFNDEYYRDVRLQFREKNVGTRQQDSH